MRDGLERSRSCIYFGPPSQAVRGPRRRLRTKLGNGISWPREFAGKVSRTPARPPPELLLRPDSAGLPGAAPPPSRRLQALKTTPTAVPLTASATVLQAARAGTHHPGPQHEAVTFQRHLPPTRPVGPPKTQPNNSRHSPLYFFFLLFQK